MAKKSPSFLIRVEMLIAIIFFLVFSIWSVRKCNATKERYRQQAEQEVEEERTDSLEAVAKTKPPVDTAAAPAKAPVLGEGLTPLYVTIDGLNMRAEPNLNSPVIVQMKLYEVVYFMNEVTSFKDSINLGKVIAFEPWVKVKHRKGRVGWVYGAGVSYYKTKQEGVE